MLYYGDRACTLVPAEVMAHARSAVAAPRDGDPAALERLRDALVEVGELAQVVADGVREALGADDDHPACRAAHGAVLALAAALWAAREGRPPPAGADEALDRLAALHLPPRVRARVPEGHAHYALYPEAYGEAARGLGAPPPVVIGIRTIGTGLAAMVAAAAGAPEVITVRPEGHPYERRLRLGPALARRLGAAAAAGARFAVVDEGPGASGSSFAAVTRWLEEAGAAPGQVVVFPGHDGEPGAAATPATRARWARTERRTAPFERVVLPAVAAAAAREAGAPAVLADLSAGRWRLAVCGPGATWPPVFAQQERRKYLARGPRGAVLLRFAGVAHHGRAAVARLRPLAEAGLVPGVLGLAHGFALQRWVEGTPLPQAFVERGALVRQVGRYLALRQAALPAGPEDGAGPAALLDMIRVNAAEALGGDAAVAAAALVDGAHQAAALPRVAVDGKLEAWEWLVTPDGRLLKTDAADHAAGHDLVGCQPIAWDVAAAAIELGLGAEQADELAARAGAGAGPAALAFLRAAYLAHRVGRWTFALQAEGDPAERARIAAALDRYRELLRAALGVEAGRPSPRPSPALRERGPEGR